MEPLSHTGKPVALFAVCLVLAALVVFRVPEVARVSFVSLAAALPLVGLLFVQRHALELQTRRVLLWAVLAAICFFFTVQAIRIIQSALSDFPLAYLLIEEPELTGIAPKALSLLGQISVFNALSLAFFLGAIAGFRWPDGLIVPLGASRTRLELRVAANIVAIVLMAILFAYTIIPGYSYPIGILWFHFPDLYREWQLGANLAELLAVSLAMIALAEWPMTTPQLRRVILGGLAGMVVMVVLGGLLVTWMEVEFAIVGEGNPERLGLISWMPEVFGLSTQVFIWVGLAIGAWAGLRWPERLWLPTNFRAEARSIGLERCATALVLYSVLAVLIYILASLAIVNITHE